MPKKKKKKGFITKSDVRPGSIRRVGRDPPDPQWRGRSRILGACLAAGELQGKGALRDQPGLGGAPEEESGLQQKRWCQQRQRGLAQEAPELQGVVPARPGEEELAAPASSKQWLNRQFCPAA